MAESSIGVKLQYSTNSGASWSAPGCILEVDLSGIEVDIKEATCLNQTDRWKTFFAAFIDAGEITASVDWAPTDFQTLLGMAGDDPIPWRIVVPDGDDLNDPDSCTRFECDGLLKMLGMGFPSDGDRVKAPLTIKLSGAPTLTLAS